MATSKANNKSIDERIPVPAAVRRLAEEANRMQEAHIAGEAVPGAPELTPEPAQSQARPQPTHASPGAPAASEQPPQPTNPEPAREPQPTHSTPAPSPDESDPNSQTWQARYDSERGRAAKLRQDISGLSTQVTNLEQLIATLQTAPSKAAAPEMTFERKVTPEMETEWGPDFFKAVEARATELIAPLEAKLNAKIESLGGNVETVSKSMVLDARQRMLRELDNDTEIKDWRVLNDDENFFNWLQYPDAMAGRKRHDMLIEAFNANNASRVAAFFRTFLRERSASAPQPDPGQGNPAPAAAKPSLDQFVAPGRVRSAPAAPGTPDREIITSADITRFYADKAAQRFNTPDLKAKAEAYEKEIFAAQREGRVVMNN